MSVRKCKSCKNPLLPEKKYRTYQKECWDCWNSKNSESKVVIPKGHIYIAEYFNMHTQKSVRGVYKIGATNRANSQKRIAEIGDTTGPLKVRIIRSWDSLNPFILEKKLHDRLNDKNITGEWFNISRKDLIKIVIEEKSKLKPDLK